MGSIIKKLAYLSILGFPLSLLGTKLNLFDYQIGMAGVKYTLFLALGVFVLGIVVWFSMKRKNPKSSKAARNAVFLALIPIIGIGNQISTARSLPPIHNISTDVIDPPQFSRIVELRSAEHNPLEYDKEKLAPLQQKAYPNVKSYVSRMGMGKAHSRAIAVAQELGWEVVNHDDLEGIVEAVDTSAMWGFKDDIVIRLRSLGGQTKIDLRSVSRVGVSDIGANAERIEAFIEAFDE